MKPQAKTHYLTLRVIFDKPVTKKMATLLARDAFSRDFPIETYGRESIPTSFKVAKVIPVAAADTAEGE